MKIALAGNPNCGKTTLFNILTGSNQYVGNWPGVTVEKKEGKLKKHNDVIITDLPGIYSLSPYTLEEVVARNYLINEKPDAIINIVDGTNLERNLYLTTQLAELGIPMILAVNMIDLVQKSGDKLDIKELSNQIGCKVICISAAKGEHVMEAAELAIEAVNKNGVIPRHSFSGAVEHVIAHIEEHALSQMDKLKQRWYAIKLFERDKKVMESLQLSDSTLADIEEHIKEAEAELEDDAESIITNERYIYVAQVVKSCYVKKHKNKSSISDKIDKIVTNRYAALPIFVVLMFLVYSFSMSSFSIGTRLTDWVNDGLFGEGWSIFGLSMRSIPEVVSSYLDSMNTSPWLKGLLVDGVIGGVGAVLGFLPQIAILFIFLSFLEACGYMSRIAFIMDRIFRKFGLSGKSFIPILVATGCGVPGIMSARTIEDERDRKITIMTTTFIPCSAKLPFIALIAGVMFGGSAWVSTGAYFIGIGAIVTSGIILKKTKQLSSEASQFVMELPAYHMPKLKNIAHTVWQRVSSYIKRAGTIILLSAVLVWVLTHIGVVSGHFGLLDDEEINYSILAMLGRLFSWIFIPLGWGNWQATVATATGLIAKENIVGTLTILYEAMEGGMASAFTPVTAFSFLVFNLLCAPCFAAMGAVNVEMRNRKWFWYAIGYETCFAYFVAFIVNQIFGLFNSLKVGSSISTISIFGFIIALAALSYFIYLLVKPNKYLQARS